jgi:hypothetical protein
MTSKAYFKIAGIFMVLYIITTFGVIVGLSDWAHRICTVIFAGAAFLGVRQKKIENNK